MIVVIVIKFGLCGNMNMLMTDIGIIT